MKAPVLKTGRDESPSWVRIPPPPPPSLGFEGFSGEVRNLRAGSGDTFAPFGTGERPWIIRRNLRSHLYAVRSLLLVPAEMARDRDGAVAVAIAIAGLKIDAGPPLSEK